MVIRKSAVDMMQSGRTELLASGPITYSGIGDNKSVCTHGVYSVQLPLLDGHEATSSGLCLDKITANFPK